ncbi:MAG: DUF2206 domain-containing protein, partial [Planctomycetes bacterium]|nr:DUF2206 domain-containing protein [Planctomycetota bacterium]
AFSAFPFKFELNASGKLVLLIPAFLPLLSILGMRHLNSSGSNTILLVFFFLVSVAIIVLFFARRYISRDTYPVALIMISFALLSVFWMRSEHVFGVDIHKEFYLFHATYVNAHWDVFLENSSLDSCLSISVLPALFQSVFDVNWEEYLFKGIYVFICTFTPLTIYIISRKYLADIYAFLAAIFFVSAETILSAAGSPRTNVGIFFFALIVLILFHKDIKGINRTVLIIAFMASLVVSHYSTTYIAFFLLLSAWLLASIFKRDIKSAVIPATSLALFTIMIYVWNDQWTQTPFIKGVDFINEVARDIHETMFPSTSGTETADPMIGKLAGEEIAGGFLSWTRFAVTWGSFICMGTGIIFTLLKLKKKVATSQQSISLDVRFRSAFEVEYALLALMCGGILVSTVVIPYASRGYDMQRVYSQATVVLAPLLMVGGIILARYIRLRAGLIILPILIAGFLFTTGIMSTVFYDNPSSVMLISPNLPDSPSGLVRNQELTASRWLQQHMQQNSRVDKADHMGRLKLISQGKISPDRIEKYGFVNPIETGGYVYFSYPNIIEGELRQGSRYHPLAEFQDDFADKDRVFTNGGSELWK